MFVESYNTRFSNHSYIFLAIKGRPSDLVTNVLDYDIAVSEFEPQSRYYVHFRINTFEKSMTSIISRLWIK